MTTRVAAKEQRRQELIAAASEIIAERGYHSTRLEDVGAAAGISGPAVYRHFSGKEDLLGAILIEISDRLLTGGRRIAAIAQQTGADPAETMRELVRFHVEFAVTEPDRILVQSRELGNLCAEDNQKVRALQREYIQIWSEFYAAAMPHLGKDAVRLRIQLVAGLINSAYHLRRWTEKDVMRTEASVMALRALDLVKG